MNSPKTMRRPKRKMKRKSHILAPGLAVGGVLLATLIGALLYGKFAPHNAPTPKAATQNSDGTASVTSSNPLHGAKLFVAPSSNASRQAQAWRATRPVEADAMDTLAELPTAKWLTSTPSLAELDSYLAAAEAAKAVPVVVAHNIPLRDCGRYSAGGANAAKDYQAFINSLANRLGEGRAVVILEPDALAGLENVNGQGQPCLSEEQKAQYYSMLEAAVVRLKAQTGTIVYLDAGNSAWVTDTAKMAARLKKAGVAGADGFSLNISSFQATSATTSYGQAIANKLGGKHFVIDTSRNGLGRYTNPTYSNFSWCNPPGRALGHFPTTSTDNSLVDAYLYIKYPGESDGQDPDAQKCFGGPKAGEWWADYALGLIERWPSSLRPPR